MRAAAALVLAAAALLAACKPAPATVYCGDGVVSAGEECDDGNLAADDDCLPTCVVATCGDHAVRAHPASADDREDCDQGAIDTCACNADCSAVACGDRHRNPEAGEACDDGNTADGDGCRGDCRSDETCGNGVVDRDERCDDGNQVAGDGCSADCRSDEICGNGIVDRNEWCDDGNRRNDDGCPNNCLADGDGGFCGDGIVGPQQDCDAGGVETASCDYVPQSPADPNSCTFAFCGDGHRNPLAGEECDDANLRLDDDCVGCKLAVCGDGATDRQPPGLEECDLGTQNGQPGATCSATCTRVP